MSDIVFLSLQDVLEIHADQLKRHGGREGFVDKNVVESAVAQPQARMFGEYLHPDIPMMAAAYLFHLAASQGFIDGNKRTGAASATEFLARNGYMLSCAWEELYDVTMRVANNLMAKEEIADWIFDRVVPIP
jgi:death-on-curing protein